MADGSKKAIESVKPGEFVLGYDVLTGEPRPARVTGVHPPKYVDHFFVMNDMMRMSATQPVLSAGKWVEVGELEVGDLLTSKEGIVTAIFSMRRVDERVRVYNLEVSEGTYVVHGIVAHNKLLAAWLVHPDHGP